MAPSASSIYFEWDVSSSATLSDPGYQSNTVGDTITLQVQAHRSRHADLHRCGLPTGLTIKRAAVYLREHRLRRDGHRTFTTTVTVNDAPTASADTFTWVVACDGQHHLGDAERRERHRGRHAHAVLTATGSGTLSYFAVDLPPGMVMDPTTGDIYGEHCSGDAAYGPLPADRDRHQRHERARATFLWAVSSPLTLAQPLTRSVPRAIRPR